MNKMLPAPSGLSVPRKEFPTDPIPLHWKPFLHELRQNPLASSLAHRMGPLEFRRKIEDGIGQRLRVLRRDVQACLTVGDELMYTGTLVAKPGLSQAIASKRTAGGPSLTEDRTRASSRDYKCGTSSRRPNKSTSESRPNLTLSLSETCP